ncbi:MAG: GH3 auxin-responsive promoter family protein [bacterium]|nr:GH3 auxin-responsive promoter family protein [bacterium]
MAIEHGLPSDSGGSVQGDRPIGRRRLVDRLLARVAESYARMVLKRFLRAVDDAVAVQERVLFDKIRANAGSSYGRDHGFTSIRSYEDFIRQVPVTTYEQLGPYVERVRQGEVEAMFGPGQRVHMFAMTSGTTDRPKYVPVTDQFLADYRRGWNAFGVKALLDHPEASARPIVQVTSRMDEETAPGGLPCGAITGLLALNQQRIVRRFYVTPACVAHISSSPARYYTIMRLALAGDVGFMITASPATQLRLARTADAQAEALIRDVRDGTLAGDCDVPPSVRRQLAPRLKPNRDRAAYLQRIVERTGRLLPKDVWNLAFLANWTGGTMGLYLRDFPEYFGNTPVRDIGLLASEGRMSVPIQDTTPAGILEVTSNFYEFIPAADRESADPPVLRCQDVEVGREYFILLTNSAGFYRYDIGDQVRVVGFHGQAPVIEFLHKGQHVSSLTGEKLTEQQAVRAFEQARATVSIGAATFVLAPQWDDPPFYRLHLDERAVGDRGQAVGLADELERRLREVNIEYASKRDTGRLGGVQVNLVPPGFLEQPAHQRRGRQEQYKHRYLLPRPGDDAEYPVDQPQPVRGSVG